MSTPRLINGGNTFLLAPTAYGKTRVPEMFFSMFEKVPKPVVLTIMAIDTLGDQMVLDKQALGMTAVNLTQRTMDRVTLKRLKKSYYSFIYVSPEIFLNNQDFHDLYHSAEFRRHLTLRVIDEAYWLHLWAMKKDGESKDFSAHVTPEDVEIFRPTHRYDLFEELKSTEKTPLLLMSAICRSESIISILHSFDMLPIHIKMQTGEMVRPELRYIRVSMSEPLETAEDLLSIIPSETVVSNKELPRMLIYSGTIDRTLGVMRAICNARGNPDDINNGISDCIRRYHSLTGEEDKKERAREFGVEEKFPILSCTPAFEFGQSFKPVKIVVIMGAMDPSISNLIGGRAGRNVDCGLVIHFVQPNMPNSPNTASEVVVTDTMNNEERMHAFRLTPCCLRAAYNMDMDILYRYIPMSLTDPGYLAEMERQRTAGMAVCRCSNCDPQGAARVLRLLPQTKAADLDALIKS